MEKGIKIILCTYCRGCNAFQLRHRFTLTFEILLKINSLIVHFLCLHEIIRICYLLNSCLDHNMISRYIYLDKGEKNTSYLAIMNSKPVIEDDSKNLLNMLMNTDPSILYSCYTKCYIDPNTNCNYI